jgi:hypothetical protein
MKRVGLWAIGIGLVITVGLLTIEPGYADEKKHGPTCTLKTLRGTYVFNATGYTIGESGPEPKAIVEVIDADGDGKVTVPAVTLSLNGVIISPPNGGSDGEYDVNDDCTGTLTFLPNGPHFNIFVLPNGKEFHMIQTDPDTVFSGVSQRVSHK